MGMILKGDIAEVPQFGPFILKGEMTDQFISQIFPYCKDASDPNHAANPNLAGAIDDEYYLWNMPKDFKEYVDFQFLALCKSYLNVYLERCKPGINRDIVNNFNIEASPMWVNQQKAYEYNPTHNHGGHVSFVFYPYVPEEILSEKSNRNGHAPGSISFDYGYDTSQTNNSSASFMVSPQTTFNFRPKTGDIVFFPAWAVHSVEMFTTPDVIRYSVSGNFLINNPEIITNYL